MLASGSAGNCIALTTSGKTILIDAGIAKTKIEKRLLEVGIRPDKVAAIFITHAHGDHIKGLQWRISTAFPYGQQMVNGKGFRVLNQISNGWQKQSTASTK
ncbi:MBL fold metallo-hydrolase [Paenibacillus wynnii]|uniref:MBL fold metallo-hydrolase n=1 Tax=Paenibacillus wynnii TaxID=268407 RepID=UPI003083F7E6